VQSEQESDDRALIEQLHVLLESRTVRLLLATLVIVSLLPLGAVDVALRPVFLLAFGGELLVRVLWWRHKKAGVERIAVAFAVADALAFVSFLPLEGFVGEDRLHYLALLRLTRLLMLVRFAKDLAKDIYAILTRREQLQTLALITGAVLVLSFVSAVILSQLAIDVDDGRAMDFSERLWWSFRQLESADNLVQSLRVHPIVAALSFILTITGVFLISFIIGVGANVVDQVVKAERRRELLYRGHTVVVGSVHDGEDLIREFVRIYAKNRQIPSPERLWTWLRYVRPDVLTSGPRTFPRVALLSRRDAPPDFLVEPIMRWVVYRQGDEGDPDDLHRVAAHDAKRAILLSQRSLGHEADAVTVSALAALRAMNPDCHAYVEVDDPESKDIVLQVGGPNTVALDVPRFLGMFLCQHLLLPGVETLYRDLLTADGAEIYTHIFVDGADKDALDRMPESLDALALLRLAARHGVVLIGVYLGADPVRKNARGVVPVDGLVPWLNPIADVEDDDARALGARRGHIPTRTLRGVIGVAEGYLALRAFAAALVRGEAVDEEAVDVDALAAALPVPLPGPKRVALVGFSEALPALLAELARFVPGVEVSLFVSNRGDEALPLHRRLEQLNVGYEADHPLPGKLGQCFALEHDGKLTIYSHDAPDLARFAAERLRELPAVEAAVFLSEPSGGDRDARTALRVLRFVRLLEDNTVPKGAAMHLLAEFVSVDKGTYIQRHLDVRKCGFAHESDLRLTLIAKETIKSYFMVHSAFVPGVSDIYSRLLEERGQDIVRFPFVRGAGGAATLTFSQLTRALLPRGAIAIAIDTHSQGAVLAPDPRRAFAVDDVKGVYAIAESAHFARG
jgi:hypothetical protein